MLARGEATPLTGIPLALKDVMVTRGLRTTCGSRILENFIPPYDATVCARLRRAGAVFLGKVNMDEFAMGSSTENSAFGPSRNPWNRDYIPGGSSGGSAAAVAADLCIASLGSDTGGSIRQPASLCGVVGLKPTYGRVSRYGLVAYASSLDQIGPLTKEVRDAAILLQAIAGHDPKDSTSVTGPGAGLPGEAGPGDQGHENRGAPGIFRGGAGPGGGGRGPGGPADPDRPGGRTRGGQPAPHRVRGGHLLRPGGGRGLLQPGPLRRGEIRLPGRRQESAGNVRPDPGPGVRGRGAAAHHAGNLCLSAGYYDAYYKKASQVRALIRRDFEAAFRQCQVIATPVSPTPAFRLGEKVDDPLTMYLSDIFTISANLAGIPGISVPCGFSSRGLPIGLQLMGPPFGEADLLQAAYAFEQATDFHRRKPPF